MPKINIYESDLTTAGGLDASSNVVYVPGFAKYAAEGTGLYLFRSVNEFKEAFANSNGKFEYIHYTTDGDEEQTGTTYYVNAEKSQQYALALLSVGLPVLFDCLEIAGDNTSAHFTSAMESTLASRLVVIEDKNNYDIKFITSGGYANSDSLYSTMISTAAKRGDCTALIDHGELTTKFELENVPKHNAGKFGAMFTPWCTFQFSTQEIFSTTMASNDTYKDKDIKLNTVNMPGSLAYLLAFGTSVSSNNANWLAAAGAARGSIPNLVAPLVQLTEADIDEYALTNDDYIGVAINPIATINPYGTIIWGNRTLHQGTSGLVASSFLNIRQLVNDIKKTIYVACKSVTFEQNSDILWVKFKSLITPLLDRMQTGEGISGYELKKKKPTRKATLDAAIRIYPIEAVEDFEMTVELADDSTSITE